MNKAVFTEVDFSMAPLIPETELCEADLIPIEDLRNVDSIQSLEPVPAPNAPKDSWARRTSVALGLAASLALTACAGGGGDREPDQQTTAEAPKPSSPEKTAYDPEDGTRKDVDVAYSQMRAYYLHSCVVEDIEVIEKEAPPDFVDQGKIPYLHIKYRQSKFNYNGMNPHEDFADYKPADGGKTQVGIDWATALYVNSEQGDKDWLTKPMHSDPDKLRASSEKSPHRLVTVEGMEEYDLLVPLSDTEEPGERTVRLVYWSKIKHKDTGIKKEGYVEQKESEMICGEFILTLLGNRKVGIKDVPKDHADAGTELSAAATP